ncbi:MAG: hypothetical protein V1797_21515 [Pseudomonadota bacterium]
MTKATNILDRMRRNPRDWRIEDLQAVAQRVGLEWRQPGTSHVTFRAPDGQKVTVPAHKPINPVYVRQFVALVDGLSKEV